MARFWNNPRQVHTVKDCQFGKSLGGSNPKFLNQDIQNRLQNHINVREQNLSLNQLHYIGSKFQT